MCLRRGIDRHLFTGTGPFDGTVRAFDRMIIELLLREVFEELGAWVVLLEDDGFLGLLSNYFEFGVTF